MEEIINEAKEIAGIEKMNLYLTDEELIREDQELYYQKGIKDGIKQGIKKGIKEGIEQGIKEGIEQKTKEIILSMYKDKLPLKTISKHTQVPLDELNKIINDYK